MNYKPIRIITLLFFTFFTHVTIISKGSLTVICGSMCCGKSGELIRQISRFTIAKLQVLVLKSSLDNRILHEQQTSAYAQISSRNGSAAECISVCNVEDIKNVLANRNPDIIVIDEAQFFLTEQDELIKLIKELLHKQKKIIVAGLDVDFKGDPFGPMPTLMAIADTVVKLTAICAMCGQDTYCITQRLINGKPASKHDPLIVIGNTNYEPRCRSCHQLPE